VVERYLADPLDTPDLAQWRTEVCWPLTPAELLVERGGQPDQGTRGWLEGFRVVL